MENKPKHYGYVPDEPRKPEEYVLGAARSLPKIVLQSTGQWDEYLPEPETQYKNGLETMNCTVYGTLNALEVLLRRKYGIVADFSERFIGIVAGTTIYGNSPHKVIEKIREIGLILEKDLPFDELIKTWIEYYSPNPMVVELLEEAKKFLDKYEIGHEWVEGDIDSIMEALTYSPLGVAVQAWPNPDKDGIYHREGNDTHWCLIFGYRFGSHWWILDTYDFFRKKLAWDYKFFAIKRYHIEKKAEYVQKSKNWVIDLFWQLVDFFKDLADRLIKQNP